MAYECACANTLADTFRCPNSRTNMEESIGLNGSGSGAVLIKLFESEFEFKLRLSLTGFPISSM